MTERADQFTITLAQLNPTVGDVEGNAAKARAARDKARADRRRSRGAAGTVHRRLSAGRPGAEAGVPGGLPRGGRGAGAGDRRWRAGHADRQPLGRGRQALQCLRAARRRAHRRASATRPTCRITACSTKSACSRAGPPPGPVTVRGVRVGVPICEDIWLEESEDYENVVECLAETGAEILVVPNGSPYARDKNDRAAVDRGGARHRKRAAADLSQPGRRPGRTGVRRRLLCAERRSVGRGAIAGLRREHHDAALDAEATTAGAAPGR